MEIKIDDVPSKDDLVTESPRIENGHLIVPAKPGWVGRRCQWGGGTEACPEVMSAKSDQRRPAQHRRDRLKISAAA
jgi:hypothetical protein